MRKNNYTEAEIQFLKENYPSKGGKYCSEYLNRTMGSIHSHCILHKIKRIKSFEGDSFNMNNVLPIKDKEIAYYLGFLWADGYLNNRSVRIEIVKNDGDILYNIIKSFGNFKTYTRLRKDRTIPILSIGVYCIQFYKFLVENDYHIKSQTSPTKILSKIPKKLKPYFYRGWIDGDGCFYINGKCIQFSLAGSYDQDWSDFEILLKSLSIRYRIKKTITPKGHKSSIIRITSRYDIKLLCEYLYNNNDKIYLERKYNKYLEILDFIKTRETLNNK